MRLARWWVVLAACAVLAAAPGAMSAEGSAKDAPKETAKKAVQATGDKYSKKAPEIRRFWANAEYLALWTKDAPAPDFPLLTLGDNGAGTPAPGALGDPATTNLYKARDADYGVTHGTRLSFGAWIDEERRWGVEASGTWTPVETEGHRIDFPVLPAGFLVFTPFTLESNGPPRNLAIFLSVGAPDYFEDRFSTQFWSSGVEGLRNFKRTEHWSFTARAGFTFMSLEDDYRHAYYLSVGAPFVTRDRFNTINRFYGANLGVDIEFKSGRFYALMKPHIALGVNEQQLRIRGASAASGFASSDVGIFAARSNLGDHHRARFGAAPGIDLKGGVTINKHLDFKVGYTLTYWTDVIRAATRWTCASIRSISRSTGLHRSRRFSPPRASRRQISGRRA